jgi:hypothetical protein
MTVLVVPGLAFGAEGAGAVRRRWEECLGEPLPLEVRLVDRISPLPSGKIKAVVSETAAEMTRHSPAHQEGRQFP